jgi:hypothetical protein
MFAYPLLKCTIINHFSGASGKARTGKLISLNVKVRLRQMV